MDKRHLIISLIKDYFLKNSLGFQIYILSHTTYEIAKTIVT